MKLVVKPEKIRDAALNSVASINPAKEIILPGKIETLVHLQHRLDELTTLMIRLCKTMAEEDLKIITSIDRINTKTAAPFIAELGDRSITNLTRRLLPLRVPILRFISQASFRETARYPKEAIGT